MGRWAGWEGKGGPSRREGWEIHWQGCRVIHDPDRQGAVSSWRAPAHEGGAFSSARLPHPQLPWLCPVRVAASLKPKAAPLCAQLPIVPPSSFSLPTYTHTHNLHPQLTSRPEALLPNPATSTLFHTVPPADLPLFSPLLNNLPHRSSCSLGLDSLHLLSSCSQTIPSRPKGYLCFFLLLNTTSFHKENKPVLENFAGCARPKDITSLFTTAVVQSNNKFSCSTRTTRVYQFTFDKFVRC